MFSTEKLKPLYKLVAETLQDIWSKDYTVQPRSWKAYNRKVLKESYFLPQNRQILTQQLARILAHDKIVSNYLNEI